MAKKLYPFSMSKHAHDLELARNVLYLNYIDVEGVSPKMEAWAIDRRERLTTILLKSNGCVAWLTGEEYGFVQKVVAWAQSYRVARNDERTAFRIQMGWE